MWYTEINRARERRLNLQYYFFVYTFLIILNLVNVMLWFKPFTNPV